MNLASLARTVLNVGRKLALEPGATVVLKTGSGSTLATVTKNFYIEQVPSSLVNEAFTKLSLTESEEVTATDIETAIAATYGGISYKAKIIERPSDTSTLWVLALHTERI